MTRARELGIEIGLGRPGEANAITDVAGVTVGYSTIIRGRGRLTVGRGPVRTGVTVVRPHDGVLAEEPLFAGCHRLNGNGELTGLEWVREAGLLSSPIALTNSHSVGVVRDALVAREVSDRGSGKLYWSLPVVGETWDGMLNDVNGRHVRPEHVNEAMDNASDGSIAEGNVGGGTGMVCHDFKGGVGTASRRTDAGSGNYTVGVLVQANHGVRERLQINGAPVGQVITNDVVPPPDLPEVAARETGSIIVVVATDAPLLPHQCTRLAQRAGLGIAWLGATGGHFSGDIFIAFSTGNRGLPPCSYTDEPPVEMPVRMLNVKHIDPLFDAAIEATAEAVVNALLAAETMVGRDGITAHALEGDRLVHVLRRYRRLKYSQQ